MKSHSDLSIQVIIDDQGTTRNIELGERTTIGRGNSNQIQIPQTYISSKHSSIIRTETGEYLIEDCGSTNGTFVNDEPVTVPRPVQTGDVLRFGLAACKVVFSENFTEAGFENAPASPQSRPVWIPKIGQSTRFRSSDILGMAQMLPAKRKKVRRAAAKDRKKGYLASHGYPRGIPRHPAARSICVPGVRNF